MSASDAVRRRVLYSGRVQGVGFRMTCAELARGFDVGGFVRNLPDGTVELEAEGPEDEVAGLLGAIGRRFTANIQSADASDLPPEGGPRAFDIRY